MAEKTLKTILKLNKKPEQDFVSSNPVLKEGEVVLSTISNLDETDTVLMKVGNGVQPYDELPWLSALAADVYDWAKAETKPTYEYSEIQNREHGHLADDIAETVNKKFVSQAEKVSWDNKAEKTVATSEVNGLMSSADKQKLDNIFLLVYPIGSIYISVVNTNPGTLFGGTWVAFGTGRTVFGVDSAQTEFNTVEKTGGSKETQISIPSQEIPKPIALESETTPSLSGEITINTIPPYITVYMWKRIS